MVKESKNAAPRATDGVARSPLYRRLEAAGARCRAFADTVVVADCGASPEEEERLRCLAWADFSPLPRLGYKGWEALSWLRARGLGVGESGETRCSRDGLLAARMGDEALLLGAARAAAEACQRCAADWEKERPSGVFPVPRQSLSAWLRIGGTQAPAMFAKLCALDLRTHRFPNLRVAQTVMARMNVLLLREDCVCAGAPALPAYHLLMDSAAAEYLWECIGDAALEFDGVPVGCDAFLGAWEEAPQAFGEKGARK